MKIQRLVSRSFQSIILVFLVTIVVFLMLHLMPSDPAVIMLGENARPEQVESLRRNMGLDLPLYAQYFRFLKRAIQGDFGESIRAQKPAMEVILERLPATIKLTIVAFLIAIIIGIPIGLISSVKRFSIWDHGSMGLALLGQSMPVYWLGLMLIILFGVKLRWLPASGMGGISHIIMPSITLSIVLIGLVIRLTRSSMLEVLAEDYVRTARAKGLAPHVVLLRHALRNALIPLVTVLGMRVGQLLGGAVITETVFAWPGIGMATVTAIHQADYPVVQAAVLILSLIVLFINWAVDMLYSYLDPRIR